MNHPASSKRQRRGDRHDSALHARRLDRVRDRRRAGFIVAALHRLDGVARPLDQGLERKEVLQGHPRRDLRRQRFHRLCRRGGPGVLAAQRQERARRLEQGGMCALPQTAGFDRVAGEGDEGLELVLRDQRQRVPVDDALDRRGALQVGDGLVDQDQHDRRNDHHELREDPQLERLYLDHDRRPLSRAALRRRIPACRGPVFRARMTGARPRPAPGDGRQTRAPAGPARRFGRSSDPRRRARRVAGHRRALVPTAGPERCAGNAGGARGPRIGRRTARRHDFRMRGCADCRR